MATFRSTNAILITSGGALLGTIDAVYDLSPERVPSTLMPQILDAIHESQQELAITINIDTTPEMAAALKEGLK